MSAKKKEEKSAVENHKGVPVTPKGLSNKTVTRKVTRDEVIQLQKEGKLVSFDPVTQMGVVREDGHPVRWPGGDCEADRSLTN